MRSFINMFGFASKRPKSIEENERFRKKAMLYMLMGMGIFLTLVMGSLLWIEKNYFFSKLDFFMALVIVGLILLVRRGTDLFFCSIFSIVLMQVFFMFLFHSGTSNHMTFIWYYLFPLISLFLLGIKLGSFFSLFMIFSTFLINVFSPKIPFISHFPDEVMIRFLFSYLGVFLFACAFEWTRVSTQEELEHAVSELNEMAIRDSLTGLYNRRYMDEVIGPVVNRCRLAGYAVGFIMADLDYFKKFNDTYGHQEGDRLLNAFSTGVASLLRRQTDYVFRYGGEEFAFLLPSTNLETTEKLAQTINQSARDLHIPNVSSPFGTVTVSVGAVFLEADTNKAIEKIVSIADEALYEAKNSGRNKVVIKTLPEDDSPC